MTWSWRMESTDGGTVDGVPSERFPSQADAESWVGEAWQDLLSQGVDRSACSRTTAWSTAR